LSGRSRYSVCSIILERGKRKEESSQENRKRRVQRKWNGYDIILIVTINIILKLNNCNGQNSMR
jgi:hypothetical protein